VEGEMMDADKVIVDAATAEALRAAQTGTELIGPDGKPIGGFVPLNVLFDLKWMLEYRKQRYDEAWAAFDAEARTREFRPEDGIPHEEVVRRLGLE
jgi:hypothetical protein